MTEEKVAIGSVIARASTILLSLNDAIERALKNELSNKSSLRRSHGAPLEQTSIMASPSEPRSEYRFVPTGEGYPPAARPAYAEGGVSGRVLEDYSFSSGMGARDMPRGESKGEALMLRKIRDALLELEEQLYRVQELAEHQREERAAASHEVDCKREELLQLLQQHKGQEWQVVLEVLKFAGGDDSQEFGASDLMPIGSSSVFFERSMLQSWSGEATESDAGLGSVENPHDDLSSRPARADGSRVSPRKPADSGGQSLRLSFQGADTRSFEDWDDVESVGRQSDCRSRDVNSGSQLVVRERGHEMGSHDEASGQSEVEELSAGTGHSGNEMQEDIVDEGDLEGETDLGAVVMSLPGKALGLLGDAAGHVASFSVKVAVVTLGVAAVFSVGDKLMRAEKVRIRSVGPESRMFAPFSQSGSTPKAILSPGRRVPVHTTPSKTPEKRPAPVGNVVANKSSPPPIHSHNHSHSHSHSHSLPSEEAGSRVFREGEFPQCTIRERIERKVQQQSGTRRKAVYLARG